MKKALKIVVPAIILLAGFGLMQLFLSMREEPPKMPPSPRQVTANAMVVQLADVEAEIVGFGRLKSAQPVQLISEVAGTLERGDVAFLPGQRFRRGDTLVQVDSRQIRLELSTAKSDFLNALASVLPEIRVDYPDEYATWQNYFDACAFDKPLPELPDAKDRRIKLFLSRYNVYKLYFSIRNQEIRLEKHFFVAPFNGSVVTTELRAGSSVRSGSMIGSIINLDDMEVEVPIPADDVSWIDRSKPVVLTSSEMNGTWYGRVSRVGDAIDKSTQTIPVFVSVGNGGGLYDGAFLRAEIPGKPVPNAVEVPRKALYNEHYVYLIDRGTLDYRKVNILRKQTTTAIISNGIASGDTLVVELLQGVSRGMPAIPIIAGAVEGTDS